MQLTFSASNILLLGGSSAIGLATARLLQQEGVQVILSTTSDAGIKRIHSALPSATPLQLNLCDASSLEKALGNLPSVKGLLDLAHAHWEALLPSADGQDYFTAHIAHRQKLLRHITRDMLLQRSGRLVYVSSTAATIPAPGQGFYCTTKRAAEGMYLATGLELHKRGISSLCLRLGLTDAGRGQDFAQHQAPTRPLITVQEAASTLCYLLSDEARAFHGTILTMDQGLSAHKEF